MDPANWSPKLTLRRALFVFTLATILTVAVHGALFTELGILVVGHRYWMYLAARSTDEAEVSDSIHRVLGATQYGVNVAENWVLEIEDRQTRRHLWRKLIELAPNENWRELYHRRLAMDSNDGGDECRGGVASREVPVVAGCERSIPQARRLLPLESSQRAVSLAISSHMPPHDMSPLTQLISDAF